MVDLFDEVSEKTSFLYYYNENAGISDFDFWATSYDTKCHSSVLSNEDLTKFLKYHIKENRYLKENVEELCNKCSIVLKDHTLSEKNEVLLLKLLSRLSSSSLARNIIRSTGLLNWVEKHSQNDSPKFFLESWKILHNLNVSDTHSPIYLDGIYLFTPPWKVQTPVADVVLVHGIKGGAAWTWRQHDSKQVKPVLSQQQRLQLLRNDTCDIKLLQNDLLNETYTWMWPLDWLSQKIEYPFRIIAVNYPSYWWEICEDTSSNEDLNSLCEDLLTKLKVSGVGSRPTIWMAHSLGGILIKKMIHQEIYREKGSSGPQSILNSTKAIVFLSVPHFGSPMASWTCSLFPLIRPSPLIYSVKADCPNLLKMNNEFVDFCHRESVRILSLNENQPCKLTRNGPYLTFVPSRYGNPQIGEFHEVAASHLDICKPKDRSDEAFKLIEEFIIKVFESMCDQ